MKIEQIKLAKLKTYEKNARTHSPAQVTQLAAAITEFGFTNPILIDEANEIIAGHGRALAAASLGMDTVPCIRITGLSPAKIRALRIADNQIALNAGWNEELLRLEIGELKALDFDIAKLGFSAPQLRGLEPERSEEDIESIPVVVGEVRSKPGDIFVLGRHRLSCGDATQQDQVSALLRGKVDFILTDPPYCSGGFQEAGRSSGSIGVRANTNTRDQQPEVANDKLSTRGYLALMKAVLGCVEADGLYCFTDWRMWINLYDVAESSGYGVRSMIVWDKGFPGMGRGWRSQHEIILFAAKAPIGFEPKSSRGNVIQAKRTGNLIHPTQKPVDLLRTLLATTDSAKTIYDPFSGAGSTLIACEEEGRDCRALELKPAYCDVIVKRWQQFTGKQAAHEADGALFDDLQPQAA